MNIRYRGASEETGGYRLAEIQYEAKEESKVDRFLLLMDEDCRKYHGEEEVVTIEVDDKDDYDYIKGLFQAFKKVSYNNYIVYSGLSSAFDKWEKGYLTDEGLYNECAKDIDFYICLVYDGYSEEQIKNAMNAASGGPDAYTNALNEFYMLILLQKFMITKESGV